MRFTDQLAAHSGAVQTCLREVLSDFGDLPVAEGMRYALGGGKGLRGFLVMETAALFDVPATQSVWAAAAIEAMHSYSLVHDDLPCMDDDDLRRGLPTVHVKWDVATATLVGDALQSLAFELITMDDVGEPRIRVALAALLAQGAGAQGMVLGQAQDIAAESAAQPLTLDQIIELQGNKTGALIEWSCVAGAILGHSDPAPLRKYARALGLAFQIADDILDVEGDAATVGKAVGKDADAGKATFVSLLGLEQAKAQANDLVAEAEAALLPFGARAETLRQAARFVISRQT
jgi:farnesyl diphosphate synthase